MLKIVLALFLLTASTVTAAPATTQPTPSQVFLKQKALVEKIKKDFPKVADVKLVWEPCGQENSFYWPNNPINALWGMPYNQVTLCTEMGEHPDAALFFAAHEMGHAITEAYTDTTDEADADEIGALLMIKYGLLDELLGAALYEAEQEPLAHVAGDSHPSAGYRAWFLTCMEDGFERGKENPTCHAVYYGTLVKWNVRINDEQTD